MSDTPKHAVTELLVRWRAGDAQALERLTPLVYEELRRIAHHHMRSERPDHTLPATALVHEAFTRLVSMDVEWRDRVHFLSVAARAMRRILVEHARARARQRRGGGWRRVPLEAVALVVPEPGEDLLAINEAIARLEQLDERKGKAVEMHYFGGLAPEETAAALGVSTATVFRDLRFARAWLHKELALEASHGP